MAPTLRFRDDGSFTIVQITDTHYQNGEPRDLQTLDLLGTVVDAERPDLVVLTGDVIAGGACLDPADSWRKLVAPLESRGQFWMAVFGNHDDEGGATRADLMAVQREQPHCLSEPGPPNLPGVGNYVLPVAGGDGRLAAALYGIDSLSYAPRAVDGYAWVTREQIGWYLGVAAALAPAHAEGRGAEEAVRAACEAGLAPRASPERSTLPALAFMHIPLPEYDAVWDHRPCRGSKYEAVCCPKLNSGLFAAMVEAGDVMGVFVGHDHVNDFEGELHGVRLCYGRGSGYNTYGREGFPLGARVIRLREGCRGFETWIRLHDGGVAPAPPEHAPEGRVLTEEG